MALAAIVPSLTPGAWLVLNWTGVANVPVSPGWVIACLRNFMGFAPAQKSVRILCGLCSSMQGLEERRRHASKWEGKSPPTKDLRAMISSWKAGFTPLGVRAPPSLSPYKQDLAVVTTDAEVKGRRGQAAGLPPSPIQDLGVGQLGPSGAGQAQAVKLQAKSMIHARLGSRHCLLCLCLWHPCACQGQSLQGLAWLESYLVVPLPRKVTCAAGHHCGRPTATGDLRSSTACTAASPATCSTASRM